MIGSFSDILGYQLATLASPSLLHIFISTSSLMKRITISSSRIVVTNKEILCLAEGMEAKAQSYPGDAEPGTGHLVVLVYG
jgi:hypothetical protein